VNRQTGVDSSFVLVTSTKPTEQCSLISVKIRVLGFEAICRMSLLRCMKMPLACAMSQLRSVCSSKNTSHLTDNSSDSKPVHKNDSSLPNASFRN